MWTQYRHSTSSTSSGLYISVYYVVNVSATGIGWHWTRTRRWQIPILSFHYLSKSFVINEQYGIRSSPPIACRASVARYMTSVTVDRSAIVTILLSIRSMSFHHDYLFIYLHCIYLHCIYLHCISSEIQVMSEFSRAVLVLRLTWKWISRGCKRFTIIKILHLFDQWDLHSVYTVLTPCL